MKKLSLLLSALFLMCVISCKDACDGILCNDGVCIDGTCLCDDGFEGTLCDVETRSKYYGTWSGPLSGCIAATPVGDYPIPPTEVILVISENSGDVKMVNVDFTIVGFGDDTTTAEIDNNEFTLAPVTQSIEVGGQTISIVFSGTGTTVSDTEANFDLDINIAGTISTCTLTLTKG